MQGYEINRLSKLGETWDDFVRMKIRAEHAEARLAALTPLVKALQTAAEALRIVDFNEAKQEFFCRACRYRDPLGPDGNKLHADHCPWVHYVETFKRLAALVAEQP